MDLIQIPATNRSAFGKKSTKDFRKEGLIPAVIYGGKENVHFGVKRNDVKAIIYTPDFKLAEITVDGNKHKCLIKSIQFHPVTDAIEHIDFLELIDGQVLKAEIPVRCEGVSVGQKNGGKLVQKLRRVKIKTIPANLVDSLSVDITAVELGHSVRVSDIEAIEGIEIMNNGATPVASIEVPRALKSLEAEEEAAAAEAAAEGGDTPEGEGADAPAAE